MKIIVRGDVPFKEDGVTQVAITDPEFDMFGKLCEDYADGPPSGEYEQTVPGGMIVRNPGG